MKKVIISVAVAALVGCASTDPYTGQQKTSNTAKGAGVGAVAGAVVGAATASSKDRKKGALTGAVAGGAIGAGVGYYMDRQEAVLREQLAGSGVQVVREGDNIRLVMPGNITFDSGVSSIRSQFYSTLGSVVKVLKEFDETAIQIAGHTDNTGGADLNQKLSEDRAASVQSYLIAQGIAAGRTQAAGYSYRYPIATNDSEQGRQLNRRVELKLVPLSS